MANNMALRFAFALLIILVIIFLGHLLLLNFLSYPLLDNKILLSYAVNYLMAVSIYFILLYLNKKFSQTLGFVFLCGTLFKFLIFFIVFYGDFKEDDTISKAEFLSFFVPYASCLVIETTCLIKVLSGKGLNRQHNKESKT